MFSAIAIVLISFWFMFLLINKNSHSLAFSCLLLDCNVMKLCSDNENSVTTTHQPLSRLTYSRELKYTQSGWLRQLGLVRVMCETQWLVSFWLISDCISGSNPCEYGGRCINSLGSYRCQCLLGFMGSHCELDVNQCASGPCKNNATCLNLIGKYKCICKSGNIFT